MKKKFTEQVIVVWDSKGNYFQSWPSTYNYLDGISYGKTVAGIISGSYQVVSVPQKVLTDD